MKATVLLPTVLSVKILFDNSFSFGNGPVIKISVDNGPISNDTVVNVVSETVLPTGHLPATTLSLEGPRLMKTEAPASPRPHSASASLSSASSSQLITPEPNRSYQNALDIDPFILTL